MVRSGRNATRASGAPGWIVTVAGLFGLTAAGFAVGIVAGVVWEEPDLVLAYLSGGTEEVAWRDAAAVSAAPPEAETREDPVADPQVRRERARSVASPVPAVPAVAAPPPGRVAVQVGAFGSSEAAERLADSLRSKGFPVYVSPGTKAGEARWRVRVGPLDTREAAERAADKLKKAEKLPTWILSEDAS